MPRSLQEFTTEMHESIRKFEKSWMIEHKKNPRNYPIIMQEGNEGLWFELFIDFKENEND